MDSDGTTSNIPEGTSSSSPVIVDVRGGSSASSLPDEKTVISNRPPVVDLAKPGATSLGQLAQALVGKQLEHYELVSLVGGGGMGAVFRAVDTRLGREVAVKVLSRDHTDEETIRRFRNEAQSAARLDHPNIARVHYVGEDQGWNFIVFEFIEGINLRDLVQQRGPLPLEDALNYTLQVAEALAHSSSRDVVHRDIKPSNVLVMSDGTVKLVDMGLARLHQVESSSDDLTASGVTLGTFDYISPEQARDPRSADVRSDIYSLGCTLYYTLAGRPPFPDGTALQKLLRHNADEPPDVRTFRPELSPRVTALLSKMLAKRPSQRHQTAGELVSEILLIANDLGLAAVQQRSQVVLPSAASHPQFWSKAAQVLVTTLVLVATIIIIDALLPRGGSDNVTLKPNFPAPPKLQTQIGSKPANTSVTPDITTDADQRRKPESAGSSRPGNLNSTLPEESSIAAPTVDRQTTDSSAIAVEPIATPSEEQGSLLADGAFEIGPPPIEAGIEVPDALLTAASTAATGTLENSPPIVRLVVVPQLAKEAEAEGVEVHTSLAQAARRASELGLNEIELKWSGLLLQEPVETTQSRLSLRAAIGYRPIILFRPSVTSAASDREMFRLGGGPTSRLALQGVEVRVELPSEPSYGWSVFALRTGQALELADCIITVQDGDGTQPPVHDQVAVITAHPRKLSDTMTMDPTMAMATGATVTLDRCVVRGETLLANMPEDVPLSLRWTQGLLVTPRRLLETSGSATNPKWFERIVLKLDHVTASCRQGLFQMRRRPGAGYHFGLDVEAQNCILMTDPSAPLYEFSGVPEVSEADLHCDGEGNRYPYTEVVFLRLHTPTPGEEPLEFDLEARDRWSMERSPQVGVLWRKAPSLDEPAHAHTAQAFELDPSIPVDAGFDPVLMPTPSPTFAPSESSDGISEDSPP